MPKPPTCPLCGKPVKAKDRHVTVVVDKAGNAGVEAIRHTQPCPK